MKDTSITVTESVSETLVARFRNDFLTLERSNEAQILSMSLKEAEELALAISAYSKARAQLIYTPRREIKP